MNPLHSYYLNCTLKNHSLSVQFAVYISSLHSIKVNRCVGNCVNNSKRKYVYKRVNELRISSISSITLNIRSTPIFAKIIIFCASKIRSNFLNNIFDFKYTVTQYYATGLLRFMAYIERHRTLANPLIG